MRPPRYTSYGPFAPPFEGPKPALSCPNKLTLRHGFGKRNIIVAALFDAV